MESPKISIFTGNSYRHQYFIHHLNANFSISEIYLEEDNFPIPKNQSNDESMAWEWFFQRRNHSEKKLVLKSGRQTAKNKPKIIYLGHGKLNSPETIAQIKKMNPGFIAVFGTSILREPLLNEFQKSLFNLHIGDPEFYRGSSCNFWPVYHGKLHHLSATIHRINHNIDTGDILRRQAIRLSKDDDEQSLLLKPLILGTKLMIRTIKDWQDDSLQSIPQNRIGALYKKADFNSKVLLKFKQMVESGRLSNHLQSCVNDTSAGIKH